jgi:hypothetical protein
VSTAINQRWWSHHLPIGSKASLVQQLTQQMSPELETMPVRFASLSAPFEVEPRGVLEMHAGEIMGNEVRRPVALRPQRSF